MADELYADMAVFYGEIGSVLKRANRWVTDNNKKVTSFFYNTNRLCVVFEG